MANVEALLADTQALLARLQEGESGGADDETFFAADPARSISLHGPMPEPHAETALPASASSDPDKEATDEVYEFQVSIVKLAAVSPRGTSALPLQLSCRPL